ncbi:MAG: iron-containing alcohol dehydrogenase, partial [archaeon]
MTYPHPTEGTRVVVSPSRVLLGSGAIEEVGESAATFGSHALVVATPEIFDIQGDALRSILEKAEVEITVYDEVRPDPTVTNIEEAYDRFETEGCDVIVTLGGGSSVDAGKGVGVLATNEGHIRDFAVDQAGYEGVPNPIPPLIAVNTTAGTGSEATRSIVVTDETTATKFLIVSQNVV